VSGVAQPIEPDPLETNDDQALGIAAAALQVTQAADELQQAARRLTAVEEQIRHAQDRWRTADEQVHEAEERAREIGEQARAAEERSRAAEEQVREAEARWRAADQQLAEYAAKSAELVEALGRTRETQSEADERARRAEQQLAATVERAREMVERVRELEAKVAEAEARVAEAEEKPEVTLIVDHERTALQEALAADIRRPLTSILGLTLALKHADPQSSEGADMVKQLATNARKLDRLVGEMLALDQIANGVFQPNLRRTDLEALVRRVVEEFPDLANRDVRIQAEHVAIQIDPALTEQMVETLLGNAGRRTAPGTPVWVTISSDQGGAVIAVDDTGPEVPEGLRAAMAGAPTDPTPTGAQRAPRGATGLTLLARLAEIHGGRAWVEERPGGGASFRVFLPEAQEPNGKPDQESANDVAAARGREGGRDERATALARALAHADADERRERIRSRRSREREPALEEVPGEITI
jgi:K+-sensing histidine kinase KdpD